MRILVVTHAFPRWDGDVAGAFIERLCLALQARGHAIEVLAPSDEGKGGRDDRLGIAVERLRYGTPGQEVLAYRGTMTEAARSVSGLRTFVRLVDAYRRAVIERARRSDVDLVHAHWWLPAGIAAWRARRTARLPYLVTLHGTDVAVLRQSLLARLVASRVLRNAAGVTAVSGFLAAEAAVACRLRAADILVQPMPIDVDGLALSETGHRGSAEITLVTVGRLTRQKRNDLLLHAVRRLADGGRTVRVTLVGEGPDRQRLEALARTLGIADRARFTGAVAPADVARYLADSEVFVFPAEREGFGLAVAEALMLGVPVVVCTDGGGAREIADGGGGRAVRPDPDALAKAIEGLAHDPDARRRAVEAGAQWRQRLSADAAAAAFERAYERAIAGGG